MIWFIFLSAKNCLRTISDNIQSQSLTISVSTSPSYCGPPCPWCGRRVPPTCRRRHSVYSPDIVSTPRLHGTRHQARDLLEFLNFETDNSVSIDAQHFFIKCSFGGFHIFSIYEEDTTRYKRTFELVVST